MDSPASHRPSSQDTESRRYVVTGRVLGVGFRWFVERAAQQLGLHGAVRNTDDGAVEVLAHGTPQQLAELKQALERGPRAARVERVEECAAPQDISKYDTFRIEGAW